MLSFLTPENGSVDLYQHIDTPTRVTAHSETIIDHVYTSDAGPLADISVPSIAISDHYPISLTRTTRKFKRQEHISIQYRSYNNFDEDSFLTDLAEQMDSLAISQKSDTKLNTNQVFKLNIPGACSSWKSIKAGVPQSSILSPLLFLVYINDIVEDIHCKIRLFADNTSLYIIVDNPAESVQMLNSDMEKINQWAKRWLVSFNPTKSESLLFSRKTNKPYHPPVTMNNQIKTEVTTHKHLGLTFSNDCTWKETPSTN